LFYFLIPANVCHLANWSFTSRIGFFSAIPAGLEALPLNNDSLTGFFFSLNPSDKVSNTNLASFTLAN